MSAEGEHDDAIAWACGVAGEAFTTPLRVRPWSATLRLFCARGPGILKVTGPESRYEAGLMALLATVAPDQLPEIWAIEPEQGWILMADAGPTLRDDQPESGWDQPVWERLLAQFGQLQRAAEPLAEQALGLGVPDERTAQLPAVLEGLFAEAAELHQLGDDERGRLRALASSAGSAAQRLREVTVPDSIQHGDLHDNNVALGPDGEYVFFDFGDASVAHPFMTMFVPLELAGRAGVPAGDQDRLRDAYLDPFTDLAPLEHLQKVLDAALDLGWIVRSGAWHRALRSGPAQHEWGEPILAYARGAAAGAYPH